MSLDLIKRIETNVDMSLFSLSNLVDCTGIKDINEGSNAYCGRHSSGLGINYSGKGKKHIRTS